MADIQNKLRKWEPARETAARLGVCTKTVDRWVEAGILPEPTRINGRKYFDAGVEPVAA
jgi:DNA-binding transcriptional MerR regulator